MSRSPILHYAILCCIFYERINDDDDDERERNVQKRTQAFQMPLQENQISHTRESESQRDRQ